MPEIDALLLAGAAAIVLALGGAHLFLTFFGEAFRPRDPALETAMAEVSPKLTRETTMWKAWVGFNASHSYGVILFGLLYGYLALAHRDFLFGDPFLLATGLILLLAYLALGWIYWFSRPFRATLAATLLYVAALVVHWL